jgi:1-acyl-sn-glycerol-3-phosphate acyltransferase
LQKNNQMQKIISYPLSLIAILMFLITLIVFHPIQWICLNIFGYHAHKKSVDLLNLFLLKIGYILFNTFKIEGQENIPVGVPIIFVANHQGMYDIIGIIWFLRKFHPKFVSKTELGKGIPSVSYNLRNGGSVLIDRKNPKQAIPTIIGLSQYIEKHKRSAVIFPEGTRSKTGEPKEFAQTGLKLLCKYAPSAYMVPISINNSWKFFKFGFFPYGLANKITFTIHEALAVKDFNVEQLINKTENTIKKGIKI